MASQDPESFKLFSLEEHARKKGMWAGTLTRAALKDLCGVGRPPPGAPTDPGSAESPPPSPRYALSKITREHTPALLKIFDEILVNASDAERENRANKRKADRVTTISILYTRAGEFTCRNDGPGIPVRRHSKASETKGREVYIPEVAFCYFLAGTNLERPADSVKGGINGVGAKLANVHSARFEVETVDTREGEKRYYRLACRDRMRIIEPGEPVNLKGSSAAARALEADQKAPHTRVRFLPAYSQLDYGPDLVPQDQTDIEAWLRLRAFQLAAYVGPKVAVTFNGEACPTTSAQELARVYIANRPWAENAVLLSAAVKAKEEPYARHPWDVCLVVAPGIKKFEQVSIVNGVVSSKGPHVTHLKRLVNEAVGKKLARAGTGQKKTSVTDTCANILMVVVAAIPGADWGGQRKDEVMLSETKLRPYQFPAVFLGKVATAVSDQLLVGAESRGRKAAKVKLSKYTEAHMLKERKGQQCRLLVAEGDSACEFLRGGLALGAKDPRAPSFNNCGVYSLGGVIPNAIKKSSEVATSSGETVLVRSDQLRNNKVLQGLVEILGLDFNSRYERPEDAKKLRYGAIIISVDQDLDGCGKILSLVLVWFHLFWPNLIRHGFVKRFLTPVIRVFPRSASGRPEEFYYEEEFRRWLEDRGGEQATQKSHQWPPKYYKGLGTHDPEKDIPGMFQRFDDHVYTFTLDESSAELFRIYFGSQPSLRKVALATPPRYLSYQESQEIHRSRLISCSTHHEVDSKLYKLDAIGRQIPSAVDGLTRARRKVLAGAIGRFSSNNREIKVFQLGGYIAEHMFYHHGDASLNGTIIWMAQAFPGARKHPYLTGIGGFGSRHKPQGEKNAGAASPRYINVKLTAPLVKALFPAEDGWLLPYIFEDGERAEPEHFVPVLPTAVLESGSIPSEGWNHKCFARDFDDVAALVEAYANGDPELLRAVALRELPERSDGEAEELRSLEAGLRERFPLRVSARDYRGEIRDYRGEPHSFGEYWYDASENVIRVTELPLRVATKTFVKSLTEDSKGGKPNSHMAYIDDLEEHSGPTDVDVRVYLKPGAYDEICERFGAEDIDSIEDFLLLRESLRPKLNYFAPGGGVLEFGEDYHAVVYAHLPLRRDLYRTRVERERALTELKIEMEREIVRYIRQARELDLAATPDEEGASRILAGHGYPMFDAGLLRAPLYAPVNELRAMITRGVNVSHGYILDLKERDLPVSARERREAKIRKLEERLAEYEALLAEEPFPAASLWRAEIAEVKGAVARGVATNWRYTK